MTRFRFALIADTHVSPDKEGFAGARPLARELANGRARTIVEQLNRLDDLSFVVHLGDITDPIPFEPAFPGAVTAAKDIFAGLNAPLHFVAGNHDVADKPAGWSPGPSIDEEFLAEYERNWGPSYYSFEAHGHTFIVLNTCLLNSGMPAEQAQHEWLETTLTGAGPCWLFLHYPVFLADPDEGEHYDNIAEPARSRLLSLITGHDVRGVFAGHVHNFFYNLEGGKEFFIAPSTGWLRADYTELFGVPPIEPDHESGRNDPVKLGFFVVEVDDGAARVDFVCLEQPDQPARVGAKRSPLGTYLRRPVVERKYLPAGGVDEFWRRDARNDYRLLALWGLQLGRVRVPMADLTDPVQASRLGELVRRGYRLTTYGYGTPRAVDLDAVRAMADAIECVELIAASVEEIAVLAEVARSLPDGPVRALSLMETSGTARPPFPDGFFHWVTHGFRQPQYTELCGAVAEQSAGAFDAMVFRAGATDPSPWRIVRESFDKMAGTGLRAQVHVQLRRTPDDSDEADHTRRMVSRVVEALAASYAFPEVRVFVDTFEEIDRGYGTRTGFIDRRANPLPTYHALNTAVDVLEALGPIERAEELPDGIGFRLTGAERTVVFVPAHAEPPTALGFRRGAQVIDLLTGGRTAAGEATGTGPLLIDLAGPWPGTDSEPNR